MRKTLLLFTTTALALLLAAGMAWAVTGAPTVSTTGWVTATPQATGTISPTPPQTIVPRGANITAQFSEAINTKSLGILNQSTTISTDSSNTFYLLKGEWTARSETKNPKRFCFAGVTPPAPPLPTPVACNLNNLAKPVPATVSYTAGTNGGTATLNPTPTGGLLDPNAKYTVVVEGTGDGDNFSVKDTGGTPLLTPGTGDSIFHFTTAAS
jgi:hypothetical protein